MRELNLVEQDVALGGNKRTAAAAGAGSIASTGGSTGCATAGVLFGAGAGAVVGTVTRSGTAAAGAGSYVSGIISNGCNNRSRSTSGPTNSGPIPGKNRVWPDRAPGNDGRPGVI